MAAPASKPVVTSQLPYEDISAVQFNGKDGVFIEFEAFKDILKGHEIEKGELRNAAAKAVAGQQYWRAQSEEMRKLAAEQNARAIYGPLIGAGVGAAVIGVIWGIFEGVKAAVQGVK